MSEPVSISVRLLRVEVSDTGERVAVLVVQDGARVVTIHRVNVDAE